MKRELGDLILRELTFEAKLVTIQDVDITPDLKHAHVFVSVIGDQDEARAAMAKLHDHRVELQHALSRRVILKYTPQLHFKLDESIVRGSRIIDIMLELEHDHPNPSEEEENEQQ